LLRSLWLGFYAMISREFYVIDLYTWISRRMEALAVRLNVWLRWV
jgi:NADH-quinone oxidoreductase subunit L